MDNDLHKPAIGLPSTLSSSRRDIEARIANGPPTSAEDYLLRVRLEAETMPNVFRATPEQLASIRAKTVIERDGIGGTSVGPSAGGTDAVTAAAAERVRKPSQRLWTPTSEGYTTSRSLRIRPCPMACVPSATWAAGQLKNFADLRQYLNFWAAHYRAGTLVEVAAAAAAAADVEGDARQQHQPRERSRQTGGEREQARARTLHRHERLREIDMSRLPSKGDERGWMLKCVGSHFNVEAGRRELAVDGDDNAACGPGAAGTPPTVGVLVRLDNVTCARVLEYHVRAISEPEPTGVGAAPPAAGSALATAPEHGHGCPVLTDCRAVWIYALLARIDRPVPATTAGYIRDLLRAAAAQRERAHHRNQAHSATPTAVGGTRLIKAQGAGLATLNLLILLAQEYFGQDGGEGLAR